jgi:gliding motility-associated-like protein
VADTASYRLVTTNATCSFISNSITVNFIDNPIFQFFPADSVATCAGDSTLVQLVGNGISYQWADGFIGANRWVKTAGQYPVKAIGINQCETWDTLKVGIFSVTANAGPDIIIAPGQFAQLNGSGGVSYFWYANLPAYFNNQFIANPLTQPTADTTLYFVQVTGPNGCIGIDSVWVFVVDTATDPGLFANVQNVITPNGDGRNDFLNIPELIGSDKCELVVMDRWGYQVYRSEDYQNNWNGQTTGGAELPDGTYYFILRTPAKIKYKGPVTIIRNSK